MVTSRTGTRQHKQWRQALIQRALNTGQTRCPLCGVTLDYTVSRRPNSPEADHIQANATGGRTTLANGRIICRQCNQRLGGQLGAKRAHKQPNKPSFNVIPLDNTSRW
ncbi:HNH endonuclease [Schaalia turicensis]|uniref:HNH endonuclease n=1 Tax=Schaalia turicensis TaxID=131111 RepID=UPI00189B527B